MPASAPLTGTAGFPAGPSLARLNAVPKKQEIAKTLQTQAKSIRSWTCGRGSAKSLRPQDRLMRASSPHQARPAGKPALPGKAGAPRKSWDRRLSGRRVGGAARGGVPPQAAPAHGPGAGATPPPPPEAGWKAGAPRKSRRSQGKPALPEKTGTAGFPAGPSLARLNAAPKTQEIAKALQTQANIHPSWTCGRGSAKSLRPQARTGWDEERIPTQSLGVRLSVLRSTTQPPRT
jgi:hypothetical protein